MEIQLEKRTYKSSDIGIEKREDDKPVIKGHAALFNVVESGGWFREQVAPGAFKESLKTDDVRALWNHNTEIVLGRNKASTLKLWEDDKGLAVEIYPSDTELVRGYLDMIERGDVSQMSFGFVIVDRRKDVSWTEEEGKDDLRTIKKLELWEVSPVTFPFYKATDVSLKSEHRAWRDAITPAIYKSKIYRRRLALSLR